MTNDFAGWVEETITRVFETNAFIFVSPPMDDDPPPVTSDHPLLAMIEWRQGDWRLTLEAHPPLCQLVAANMSGLEDGNPQLQDAGEDALAEMVNMIMGNLLADRVQRYDQRELELPIICLMPPENHDEAVADLELRADGIHPLRVRLYIQPGSAGDPRS